jgi:hypothetical protein
MKGNGQIISHEKKMMGDDLRHCDILASLIMSWSNFQKRPGSAAQASGRKAKSTQFRTVLPW